MKTFENDLKSINSKKLKAVRHVQNMDLDISILNNTKYVQEPTPHHVCKYSFSINNQLSK